jgi:limonene-1,2-epoxide hydrolase
MGAQMPWFPDFANAVALARGQTRTVGRDDPVAQYFKALNQGDIHALEDVWPGEVVIYDPRAGEVRGHRQLRQFVSHNRSFLAERQARIETIASTVADGRAVVEMLAHLDGDGATWAWPIAVVAESPNDRSVIFRTYCSQLPVDGRRHLRPSILTARDVHLAGVVAKYQAALDVGDVDTIVETFARDGYLREPIGSHDLHRGTSELHAFFTRCFSAGGGLGVEHCAITDDGIRCAHEFNCVRWGTRQLPPQAGIGVYERGSDGLLAAARIYDDIEAPFEE